MLRTNAIRREMLSTALLLIMGIDKSMLNLKEYVFDDWWVLIMAVIAMIGSNFTNDKA
jgi:hypothetical protein